MNLRILSGELCHFFIKSRVIVTYALDVCYAVVFCEGGDCEKVYFITEICYYPSYLQEKIDFHLIRYPKAAPLLCIPLLNPTLCVTVCSG